MSETLGGLVDKLSVVNLKMWNNQELLYEIRRMDFSQFCEKYGKLNGLTELFETLKKCCDLNVQRNDLIDEIDTMFKKWIDAANQISDGLDTTSLLQKKHKSY